MPLVNFRDKNRFNSFDFCQNFDVQTFSRTQIFLRAINKKFFFKMLTLVRLDGFLDGFPKFRLIIIEFAFNLVFLSSFRKLKTESKRHMLHVERQACSEY
jgi:hypothetical protein